MTAHMQSSATQQLAFTLIEVLFTIAITAILMSAITLNLGVQTSLVDASKAPYSLTQLSSRLDEIQQTFTLKELELLLGTDTNLSPLSDPVGSENRRLISIEEIEIGREAEITQLLAIIIQSDTETLTRWLSPTTAR